MSRSHRIATPGARLLVRDEGAGSPVVMLHGFTGSGHDFERIAGRLGERHRLIRIDLVGHGESESPVDPEPYRLEAMAGSVCSVLDALGIESAHLLGYSMGGRVGLALAVWHPERVTSAVLVGARAGLPDAAARATRRAADEALADRIERDGVPAFVEQWMGLPLFAGQRARLDPASLEALAARKRRNDPRGLALSLRVMGAGAQPPLDRELGDCPTPMLLLAGEEDERFLVEARRIAARPPGAQWEAVPAAGHAAHLENPSCVADRAARFFARIETIHAPEPAPRTISKGNAMTAIDWKSERDYQDIRYESTTDGIAKITICRPEVRNAFRPRTLFELIDAFSRARSNPRIGVILFTGEGTDAFCSGGDQKVRGDAGYLDEEGIPHLNALDLQRVIRTLPKPVIALVAGYAIGGGHVLHLICDLTIAADNARFGQTGPRVGSFDAGFGASYLARVVGQKKAREIWYLCRQYGAGEALEMGLVNTVVPLGDLESTGVEWGRRILEHSPTAIRCLKAAFNADCDGQAGLQELAGHTTQMFYGTEEAQEGRDAFIEKRAPDFSKWPWRG